MKNKVFDFETALDTLTHSFDFLAFTENWFLNKHDAVKLQGYKSEGVYRNNFKGDGSSIYVKDGISYEVSEFSYVSVQFESIIIKCAAVLIASINHPPSGDVKEIVEHVSTTLEQSWARYRKKVSVTVTVA